MEYELLSRAEYRGVTGVIIALGGLIHCQHGREHSYTLAIPDGSRDIRTVPVCHGELLIRT